MNRTLLIVFVLLLSAFAAWGQVVNILVSDVSKSQLHDAVHSRAEQKQLIATFPNGSDLIILAVGSTVRTMYQASLDTERRLGASTVIDRMIMNEPDTALGEGVVEALRIAAAFKGEKAIWLFTDGDNSPSLKSPYRGKPFGAVLDTLTLPPDTQMYIRIFGDRAVASANHSVHIIHTAPTWTTAAAQRTPPPAVRQPPANRAPASRDLLPIVAMVLALAAFVGITVAVLIGFKRKRTADMLASAAPDMVAETTITADDCKPERIFSIFVDGRPDPVVLGTSVRTDVVIGGSPAADVFLPDCERHNARFTINDGTVPTITVRNDGPSDIHVGRRKVASGASLRLPDDPVEMRIGSQMLHIICETIASRGAQL